MGKDVILKFAERKTQPNLLGKTVKILNCSFQNNNHVGEIGPVVGVDEKSGIPGWRVSLVNSSDCLATEVQFSVEEPPIVDVDRITIAYENRDKYTSLVGLQATVIECSADSSYHLGIEGKIDSVEDGTGLQGWMIRSSSDRSRGCVASRVRVNASEVALKQPVITTVEKPVDTLKTTVLGFEPGGPSLMGVTVTVLRCITDNDKHINYSGTVTGKDTQGWKVQIDQSNVCIATRVSYTEPTTYSTTMNTSSSATVPGPAITVDRSVEIDFLKCGKPELLVGKIVRIVKCARGDAAHVGKEGVVLRYTVYKDAWLVDLKPIGLPNCAAVTIAFTPSDKVSPEFCLLCALDVGGPNCRQCGHKQAHLEMVKVPRTESAEAIVCCTECALQSTSGELVELLHADYVDWLKQGNDPKSPDYAWGTVVTNLLKSNSTTTTKVIQE